MPQVRIEQEYDGWAIIIDGERTRFDQEETVEGLVAVFKSLGFDDVIYEDVY